MNLKLMFLLIAAVMTVSLVSMAQTMDEFVTANGVGVRIYCIKHGSLRMDIGGKWLYVDPVTKSVRPETDYTSLPKADFILITHGHSDHLDPEAINQLSKETTVLITNRRSGELLDRDCLVMANGDSLVVADGWRLDAVPAYNYSVEKLKYHPKGRDNGYIVTVDGLRVYIAGDTEDVPEIGNVRNVDIAFLPCNLPYTMSPEQLLHAAMTIKPKVLFPYHRGDTDEEKICRLFEGGGIDVRIR